MTNWNSFDSRCDIDLKKILRVFSLTEWRAEVSWKFIFCLSRMDFREASEAKCPLRRGKVHTGSTRAASWPGWTSLQWPLMKKLCFWMMKKGSALMYRSEEGFAGKLWWVRSVPALNEDFSKRKGVLYSPQTLFCQLYLKYCVCLVVMVSGSFMWDDAHSCWSASARGAS